jgi:hypothetical protein
MKKTTKTPVRARGGASLVALGLCLGVGAGWWGSARLARAQEFRGQDARARGEYTMVTGRVGSGRPVVYIVDSANQEMVALRWDTGKQNFTGVGYRNILTDARAARGR